MCILQLIHLEVKEGMGAYGGEAHNTCKGQKTTYRSRFSFFHTVEPPDQNMVSAMVTSAIIHCCISQATNFIFYTNHIMLLHEYIHIIA